MLSLVPIPVEIYELLSEFWEYELVTYICQKSILAFESIIAKLACTCNVCVCKLK